MATPSYRTSSAGYGSTSRDRGATRPVSAVELRKAFLAPPPEVLRRSPLYQSLPEAAIHDNDGSILDRLRTTAPLRKAPNPRELRQDISASLRRRPVSATSTVRLSATNTSVGMKHGNTFCATEHMVQQLREVRNYETEYQHYAAALAADREKKWDAMRAERDAKQRAERMESARRRQLKQARQLAWEQVHEQRHYERAAEQHAERVARTAVEEEHKRERRSALREFVAGVQRIQFKEKSNQLFTDEAEARRLLLDEAISELETRTRAFIVRLHAATRTQCMSLEKLERVALQKYLNARTQWKAGQDAQLNGFFTLERKARQKVYDEEAFGFLEIDGARQLVVLEEARAIRRKQELLAQAIREFEMAKYNERVELDRIEGDGRSHLRADEIAVRNVIRHDFTEEKKTAAEKYKKRILREKAEWDAECARQQRPILVEEADNRRDIDYLWNRELNTIMSSHRQERDAILVPIRVTAGPKRSTSHHCTHCTAGMPTVMFPNAKFTKKTHSSYASHVVAGVVISLRISAGACPGDDVELLAQFVASTKEKAKPGLLRITIDGSVLDEDGSNIAVFTKTAPTEANDDTFKDDDEEDVEDFSGGGGGAEAAGTPAALATIDMIFLEGTDVATIEALVVRMMRSVAFKCSATNTNMRQRIVDLEVSVALGKQLKAKGRRASSLAMGPSKGQYIWHTLVLRSMITLGPAIFRALPCAPSRFAVIYDCRKRAGAGGKLNPMNLLPAFQLATTDFTLAGACLKIRFIEGFATEDIIAVAPGDGIVVKKTEIRADGQPLAKIVGKFQTTASKELIFNFVSDNGVLLPDALERLIRHLQYGCAVDAPNKSVKLIEFAFREAESALDPRSWVCRVDLCIVGTLDETMPVGYEPSEPSVFRDCLSAVAATWKKFVTPDAAAICPEFTMELKGSSQSLAGQLPSGIVKASVVHAGSSEDSLTFSFDAHSAMGAFSLGDNNVVLWAAADGGHRHNNDSDDDFHGDSSKRGKGVPVAKLVSWGRQRFTMELISSPDLRVPVVQQLVRCVAYSSAPAPDAIGCNKLIALELSLGDQTKTKGSSSSPNRAPGVAAVSASSRVLKLVQTRPSIIRCEDSLISLPRLATPQLVVGMDIAEDALSDRFDNGFVRIEFVDGRSAFELLTLAAAPKESKASGVATPKSDELADNSRRDAAEEDDDDDAVQFVNSAGGHETGLVENNEVIGTVAECVPGRPLTVRFASSIPSPHSSTPTVSFPVTGRHVRAVLRNLWYQHSEADSHLEKAVRVTAQDAFGRRSQTVVGLHIEPNFSPTDCVNPPTDVYYRHRAYPEVRGNLSSIFDECSLEDDDTENVGKCTMSLEPYDGVTADDVLDLVRPTAASTAQMRRFSLNEHPTDPSRTTICYDGREVAWCISVPVGDPEAPRGNSLKLTIKTGTALGVCTGVMRLLGFMHRETNPRRLHPRQFVFRFNAGDEDVPDTRVVFSIHVAGPLLTVLPTHETARFREGAAGSLILPQPMVGVPLASPCANDRLRFTLSNSEATDELFVCDTDNIFVDDDAIVVALAYAKQLSAHVTGATPGLSGVLAAKVVRHSHVDIELVFDDKCPLPTSALVAVMRNVMFRNTSSAPKEDPRQCLIVWHRELNKECGYLRTTICIEPEDDMTELNLQTSVVSCFSGEECRFAAGATVADVDTPVFEEGSTLVCEIQGLSSEAPVTLSAAQSEFTLDHGELYHAKRLLGKWVSQPPRRLLVEFSDCPLETLEKLINCLVLVSNDKQRNVKVVQIVIKGSPEVTPTVENIQVNIFPRCISFTNSAARIKCELDRGAIALFGVGTFSLTPISYSGATVHISLVKSSDAASNGYRNPIVGVDRLFLGDDDRQELTVTSTAVTSKNGQLICTVDGSTGAHFLTLRFPKATKVLASIVNAVLGLVHYSADAQLDASAASAGSPAAAAKKLSQSGLRPAPAPKPASNVDPAALVGTCVRCQIAFTVPLIETAGNQTDERIVEIV